jgi:hypothetical protein
VHAADLLLRQWFNLSDPAVEESMYDSAGMRQFVGVDLGCAPVPELLQTLIALEAPVFFEMLQRQYSRVEPLRSLLQQRAGRQQRR